MTTKDENNNDDHAPPRTVPTTEGPKELDLVLSYLVGRKLSGEEIYTALDVPKSTYYDWIKSEPQKLLEFERLTLGARNLGLNPIDLLVRFGLINERDLVYYVRANVELSEETMDHLQVWLLRPRDDLNDDSDGESSP